MAKKGRATQSIVNVYPLSSSIRNDEQSAGFQLLNQVGLALDDLFKQQHRAQENFYLSTSAVSDIDVFYVAQLPRDFNFDLIDDDISEYPRYINPIVSGETNGNEYLITIASGNDIESWWYQSTPDRISLGQVASGEHLLVSGHLYLSPFAPLTLSGVPHITNQLWITVSGGTSFLGVSEDNFIRRGIVQLEGTTREGIESYKEEHSLIYDDTLASVREFSSLDEVRVYGINPNTAFVKIESGRFNHPDYHDNYLIDENKLGQESPLFWSIETGPTAGQKLLVLSKYISEDVEVRLAGYVDKEPILKQEILNGQGENISILDIAIEPHSDRIWAVDDTKLYCFDTSLPYPNLQSLKDKDYEADAVMEISSYYVIKGDTVTIDYIWRRPVLGIVKYRIWVEKPDGNKYSIESGSEVAYHTNDTSWQFVNPRTRAIQASDIFTLDQRGIYTYSFQVYYTDDTTSLDRRVVFVPSIRPLCEFDLSTVQVDNIRGIDIDSEYNLWILNSTGGKHRIDKHYDQMIIDYQRRVLYLREGYDRIRILEV